MITKVLSIGHNKGMNAIIVTTLSAYCKLLMVADVFHGMLELRQHADIKLIIIDIDAQTKECVDFIQHINSSRFYKRPLIVITNAQNKQTHESILSHGIYALFLKPFNPVELINSVKINNDLSRSTTKF